MLVVWRDSTPDLAASLLPLKPEKRPAESTQDGCKKWDWLQSGLMTTHAGLWAVEHGRVWPSGDGLPHSYWSQEVPAQMNDSTDQEQRLTQVRGAMAVGFICLFFISFPFLSFLSFLVYLQTFICQRGWRVAVGKLRHLSGLSWGGQGIQFCYTQVTVHTVWINNNKSNRDVRFKIFKFRSVRSYDIF